MQRKSEGKVRVQMGFGLDWKVNYQPAFVRTLRSCGIPNNIQIQIA